MNRKGQSALEFLMTYGWAILVVLAAIGALAYFGVLNPANFISARCVGAAPFTCQGSPVINSTTIAFTVANGQGSPVGIAPANVTQTLSGNTGAALVLLACDGGSTSANCVSSATIPSAARLVSDGSTFTFVLTPAAGNTAGFTKGASFRGTFSIQYTDPTSGLPQTVPIQVSGKIN